MKIINDIWYVGEIIMKYRLSVFFALKAIKLYQKHISPNKGYACAYRKLYGGSGCSGVGFRLIRRYGLFHGLIVLRKRFIRCHAAHQKLYPQYYQQQGFAKFQRGSATCFGSEDTVKYVPVYVKPADSCSGMEDSPGGICCVAGSLYPALCCYSNCCND